MKCGLSSCRTEHNRGYLIKTTDGYETNIGNICGKKHFSVDFVTAKNAFKKETNAQRFRENLFEYKNKLDNYKRKILDLYNQDKGASWCHKEVHWYITRGFQGRAIDALIRRQKTNENRVNKTIKLTSEEIEIAKQTGNNDTFRYEHLFTINGLNSVKNYRKINTTLKNHLVKRAEDFREVDIDKLSHSELRNWNTWANSIDKNINNLKDICEDCRRFLSNQNINNIRRFTANL